jgi:Recombination endonuclease VII
MKNGKYRSYPTPVQCLVARGTKHCGRCDRQRKLKFFSKSNNTPCGYSSWCKECNRNYDKENRERFRKRKEKEWRLREYGVTPEEFKCLRKKQKNKCAVCKRKFGRTRWTKPRIDHCHLTKKKRGLLCNRCNMALGLLGDSKKIVSSALQYLRRKN